VLHYVQFGENVSIEKNTEKLKKGTDGKK
jgi:hypothetical protein